MPAHRDIAVIVGSLRGESFTRKIALAAIEQAPAHLQPRFVEIGALALYNQDLDTDTPPAAWTTFRDEIRKADAVLFATPEYNRSVPGVLKNAIDVGSRPPGKSAFQKKPAAIISVAPRNISGFGANHHLRQSLVFLDMPTLQQPEAYIGHVADLLDDHGKLKNEDTWAFLAKFMAAFADWIERTAQA
ncbi:MAG: NAD(P)H-dependent oxidoreductase [Alphaproteobacteria bacterium]